MKNVVLLLLLTVLAVAGCVSDGDNAGPLSRADILNVINGSEIAVNVALDIAARRGADVTVALEHSNLAFDLARDALAVRITDTKPENLRIALDSIKAVADDTLKICTIAGISEVRLASMRTATEDVYSTLDSVIKTLERRQGLAFFRRDSGAATERPCTSRGQWAPAVAFA